MYRFINGNKIKKGGAKVAYNVLIVEDQDIPRELFEIYINSSDRFNHLLSVANASAALSVCQNSKVDLILMDVMTELDNSGLDAAEEIKGHFPEIKIIIVTTIINMTLKSLFSFLINFLNTLKDVCQLLK